MYPCVKLYLHVFTQESCSGCSTWSICIMTSLLHQKVVYSEPQSFANFVCLDAGNLFRMPNLVDLHRKNAIFQSWVWIQNGRFSFFPARPANKLVNFRATAKNRISAITSSGYPTWVCLCKFELCHYYILAVIDDIFVKLWRHFCTKKSCNSQSFANFACLHTGKLFRMHNLVDSHRQKAISGVELLNPNWPLLIFPCPGNKLLHTAKSRISAVTSCGYPTWVCWCNFELRHYFSLAVVDHLLLSFDFWKKKCNSQTFANFMSPHRKVVQDAQLGRYAPYRQNAICRDYYFD